MTTEFHPLPADGQTTLGEVTDFLLNSRKFVGLSDTLLVRSVLVRVKDHEWINYATSLFVSPQIEFREKEADSELGDLRLISHQSHIERLSEEETLVGLLGYWKEKAGTEGFEFREEGRISRHARSSECSIPCWVLSVQEKHPRPRENAHPNAPHGPFFDMKTSFFAENAHDAAKEWLRDPFLRNGDGASIDNQYRIIIPDGRAYFSDFTPQGDSLEIEVEAMEGLKLSCCGKTYGYHRNSSLHAEPIVDGKAVLKLSGVVRDLDLYLMDSTGEWLDRYKEGENYASWGPSIYYRDRLSDDPSFADLRQALEHGEGQQVEFKEWMPVSSRKLKSDELLKTAVAFSNAEGGNLYIGVTDETEIVGAERSLEKEYGKKYKGDLSKMEDAYIQDLRKVLLESIQSPIAPTFEWIDHANHAILRIHFPAGQAKPYAIIETGDIYIRKNATSRKAYPAELQRMCSLENGLRLRGF